MYQQAAGPPIIKEERSARPIASGLLAPNRILGENVSDLTVGALRRALARFNDDDILHLPGNLTLYRVKAWGHDEAV